MFWPHRQVVHVRGTPGEIVSVSAFSFPDMVVTPDFLVDHVPWRLQRELAELLGGSFLDGEGAPPSLSDELVSFNGDVVALRRSAPKNRQGELASTRSHLGITQALGSDTAV